MIDNRSTACTKGSDHCIRSYIVKTSQCEQTGEDVGRYKKITTSGMSSASSLSQRLKIRFSPLTGSAGNCARAAAASSGVCLYRSPSPCSLCERKHSNPGNILSVKFVYRFHLGIPQNPPACREFSTLYLGQLCNDAPMSFRSFHYREILCICRVLECYRKSGLWKISIPQSNELILSVISMAVCFFVFIGQSSSPPSSIGNILRLSS